MRPARALPAFILFASWLVCAIITLKITQFGIPFPFENIDEHAHLSYTLDILKQGHWWPDFNCFPLYEASTNPKPPNYINHPPSFYWLMAGVQSLFPDASPIYYRIPSLLFYLVALAAYARLGYLLKLSLAATIAYALLPLALSMPLQSGYYNNDSMAILGGMLAYLGSFYWLNKNIKRGWLLMLAGLALASVKLTAFLLVGIYLFLLCRERKPWKTLPRYAFPLTLALTALLAAPYIYFLVHYGSPAPSTLGQEYLLQHKSQALGLSDMPRAGFIHFIDLFLAKFADQFAGGELTPLALLALVFSYGYFLLNGKRNTAAGRIIMASLLATLAVLVLHIAFSYRRYLEYGWLFDSYVRYYFPLLPAYGMAIAHSVMALQKKKG